MTTINVENTKIFNIFACSGISVFNKLINNLLINLHKPLTQNLFTCSKLDVIKIRNNYGFRKAMPTFLTQPLEV